MMKENDIIKKANAILPSEAQYNFCELEFLALINFNMCTFTNCEKGTGREQEKYFNPPELDVKGWITTIKNAGMKGVILNVKDVDGFCIWQTEQTDHSVKNSPWLDGKGDVVRAVADECREQDIKFGIYISTYDLHESTFGTEDYDKFFVSLLTELLTWYGDIFCVWFPKKTGPEHKYNWKLYYETVRKLQPEAVICDCGPDIRWVGHNGGVERKEEWSVVPYTLLNNAPVSRLVEPDLGSIRKLKKASDLVWYPPITYIPLRKGFYFHKQEDTDIKMLSNILDVYFRSVGNNGVFALCVSPDFFGKLDKKDVDSLFTLGAQLRVEFKTNFAAEGQFTSEDEKDKAHGADKLGAENGYWHSGDKSKNISVTLDMGKVNFINKIVLAENTKTGQQIEKFTLSYFFDGKWRKIYSGSTIGRKKICLIEPTNARRIRLDIKKTRGFATLKSFEVY